MNPNLSGIGELVSRDWEYRYEVICHPASSSAQQMASAQSEMLSRLGNDRWELVGIQERPTPADESDHCWIFTLKRRNRNDN